jgi:hypothetical protein
MKKLLLGVVAAVVLGSLGLFVWARTVLSSDAVRTSLASNLSEKLGQPVTIGGISASIFPRLSVDLETVTIGKPGQLSVGTLAIGTSFGALLSRRIEHATVRMAAAHIRLPLPAFATSTSTPASAPPPTASTSSTGSGVQLVSIDEIQLTDVEVTSGGHTLRGDIDLAVTGDTATIRKIALRADKTVVDIAGTLTNYLAPAGTLTVQAGALNVTDLVTLLTDFSNGAGLTAPAPGTSASSRSPSPGKMNLTLTLGADRATVGELALDQLAGEARVTDKEVTIDPVRFSVFGGTYTGSLSLTLGDVPEFHLAATLSGVDMTKVMTFVGHAGLVTGQMAGTLTLAGKGLSAADVIASAHGTAHAVITHGTVKGLGLVKGVILATSMRADSTAQTTSAPTTESFTSLDGTFQIANGTATTSNFTFTSTDLLLAATGTVRLDGTAIDLGGPLQLSDALSQQAGRDLVKYTQKDGRVTIPAKVSGSADHLHVGIDTSDLAKRAVTNAAADQAKKLLQRIGRGGGGTP